VAMAQAKIGAASDLSEQTGLPVKKFVVSKSTASPKSGRGGRRAGHQAYCLTGPKGVEGPLAVGTSTVNQLITPSARVGQLVTHRT
jgi:hypothetical protein